ncbi:45452_t:CDS:1, partial [Gigaspora margarita]
QWIIVVNSYKNIKNNIELFEEQTNKFITNMYYCDKYEIIEYLKREFFCYYADKNKNQIK